MSRRQKPPIKLLLCDLGNVLINFDHRIAVRRIEKRTRLDPREVYQLFFDSPLTKEFEEGRISSRVFHKKMSAVLGVRSLSFLEFSSVWNEIFWPNEGMLEVLSLLKSSLRLHLVSNINELHYRHIARRFAKHLRIFDAVYLSCRVGKRKPHPEIYRRAVEEHGYRVEEVLYTDDRSDLIRAARALGLRSVIFKNPAHFLSQLKKRGIVA